MKALQQEHLSQEVEDDSMKEIPDNIDFIPEKRKEISDNVDFNQGPAAGRDETGRQGKATPQEIEDSRPLSPRNIIAGPSSENSGPLSPLKQGEATPQKFLQAGASMSSEDSRPLSPLKPSIPAKPNLAILAARRLSHASQPPVQPENEETTFPSDSQNVVLSSDAQKQKESLEQNEDKRDANLIAQPTPLTSMEALTDK